MNAGDQSKSIRIERNRARSVEVSHQAFLFNISSADTLRRVQFAPKAKQLGRLEKFSSFEFPTPPPWVSESRYLSCIVDRGSNYKTRVRRIFVDRISTLTHTCNWIELAASFSTRSIIMVRAADLPPLG